MTVEVKAGEPKKELKGASGGKLALIKRGGRGVAVTGQKVGRGLSTVGRGLESSPLGTFTVGRIHTAYETTLAEEKERQRLTKESVKRRVAEKAAETEQQHLAQHAVKERAETAKQLERARKGLGTEVARRFISAGGVAYQRPGGRGTSQLYLGGATTRPAGLEPIRKGPLPAGSVEIRPRVPMHLLNRFFDILAREHEAVYDQVVAATPSVGMPAPTGAHQAALLDTLFKMHKDIFVDIFGRVSASESPDIWG